MTELFPPHLHVPVLPASTLVDDGHDWVDALRCGWHVVYEWGLGAWDLGAIPLTIVVHLTDPEHGVYAVTTYEERDVTIRAFTDEAQRDAATDMIAAEYWRTTGGGPFDLPAEGAPRPHHRGPFSWDRYEQEKHLLPEPTGECSD